MEWESVKLAIARVDASGKEKATGTAFHIGNGFAVTALHVVAETAVSPPLFAEKITLTFLDKHSTEATVVKDIWDEAGDWAVLKCTNPPNVPVMEMQPVPVKGADWGAFGYPEIQPEGKTIGGQVRDATAIYASSEVIELFSEDAAAGQGVRLHGFSGAPCIVDGRVVGVLRATLIEEVVDGKRERKLVTQAGTLYACPGKAIIDFQIAKGIAALPGTWAPPETIQHDFLVILSSSEGKYKPLKPVAKKAREKLPNLIGPPYFVPVADLFESHEKFLTGVAALCRAKVLVLDATGFEPAIMLLAGIRSAVRRGITILSVGHEYSLGEPLPVPFGITDANIVAHSEKQSLQGPQPADLLAGRISRAIREFPLSTYLDNPVYESIRRLPGDRRGLVPKRDGALVLCPFEPTYNSEIWSKRLREGLKHQLGRLRDNDPLPNDALGIARSFELNSPRLVTQAVYEYIRRAQACIVDLTLWSENVLFELGVRIAATREATSCLLAKGAKPKLPEHEEQCEKIRRLFVDDEGIYDPEADWEEERAFVNAYGPDAVLPFRGLAHGSVHKAIVTALDVDHEPASRLVYSELIDSAELFGKIQGNSKPVGLYPANPLLARREEEAEFDRLLAAWLHLYFRSTPQERSDNAQLREAVEHIAVPLMERHADRLQVLRENATDDFVKVLNALVKAFSNL